MEQVSDCLSKGDLVKVKVLEVDRQGRVRLSMKEAVDEEVGSITPVAGSSRRH